MDEADALAESLGVALERIEKAAEGLGRVHGIEHHALFPRHADEQRELGVVDACAPRALVAVENVDGLGHVEGEAVAHHGLADGVGDIGAHVIGGEGNGHAHDLRGQAGELLAHEQAGLAPAAEGRDGHRVEARRPVADLLGQLHRAFEIAQGARLVRAAFRDDVRSTAAAPHVLRDGLEGYRVARELLVGEVADLRAQHAVQEEIAVVGGGPLALHRDHRAEPEPGRHRRDGATAVRLERAHGDQGVRALVEGVSHEELELANLVAGFQQAGEVVALHVELDPQPPRHALELHDGGGRQRELDA